MQTTAIHEVDVKRIATDTAQPRQVIDKIKLKELSASIKEQGLIYPVIVTPFWKNNGTLYLGKKAEEKKDFSYWLLDGYRRVLAYQQDEHDKIPAIVKYELSFIEILEIQFASNTKRVQISVEEMANAINRYRSEYAMKNPKGNVIARLSELTGFSQTYFDTAEAINRAPKEMQKHIHAGKIGGYAASEIESATKDESMRKGIVKVYLKYAKRGRKIGANKPRTIKCELKKISEKKYTQQEKEHLAEKLFESKVVVSNGKDKTSDFISYKFAAEQFIDTVNHWQLKNLTSKQIDILISLLMQPVDMLRDERRDLNKPSTRPHAKSVNI